jgi:hypothetical protein
MFIECCFSLVAPEKELDTQSIFGKRIRGDE